MWDARFAHFSAALLHIVLTVPATVRHLVADVKRFRRAARTTVDAWFRRHYGVERDEKPLILDVFHPSGDSDPSEWAPHANIFLVARVLTPDGKLRTVRAYASKAALADLTASWTAALAGLVGQPAERGITHLSVHTRPDARKFALRAELRSFPGWAARGLGSIVWAGAFGNRVWGGVRDQLAIPERDRCLRCRAPHPHRPGEACGAPLVEFADLPDDCRAAVRAAEDRAGAIVEEWERTFDDHARTRPACNCDACERAASVRSRAHSALRATRRAAAYAMEVATDPANARIVAAGGPLHEAVAAARAAYDVVAGLPARGVTIGEARAPRQALLDFIGLAEQVGAVSDPEIPWGKRLDALCAARRARDEEAMRNTGKVHVSVNLAWDRLPGVTGPCSTLRVDQEERSSPTGVPSVAGGRDV